MHTLLTMYISITLKSLKYRHLTLYVKPPPPTHTQRSRSLPQTSTHEHINTPLSSKVRTPNIGLYHFVSRACTHLFPHSLARSPDITLSQAHALCRVYISHTHKTSPQTSISLVMWFSRTHLTHHPHCKQAHFVSLCTTLLFLSLPHADPPQLLPCIHICRDSFHSSLMYHRSRSRTLFSTPSILDLS